MAWWAIIHLTILLIKLGKMRVMATCLQPTYGLWPLIGRIDCGLGPFVGFGFSTVQEAFLKEGVCQTRKPLSFLKTGWLKSFYTNSQLPLLRWMDPITNGFLPQLPGCFISRQMGKKPYCDLLKTIPRCLQIMFRILP